MHLLTVCLLFLFLLSSCDNPEPEPPPVDAKVFASPAYLQFFGEPPAVKEGTAYARVIYLPSRQQAGYLRPRPVFLYAEKEQLERLLNYLTGLRVEFPRQSDIWNPFAPDTEIRALELKNGLLKIELDIPDAEEALPAMVNSLVATASQFAEVERINIAVNGQALEWQPAGGFRAEPEKVLGAGPPQLLSVVGNWNAEDAGRLEIQINFDRPVEVKRFTMMDEQGERIAGQYFTSAFAMAVIVHPEQPKKLRPGMPLRVSWSVSDLLDRQNSSDQDRQVLKSIK